MMTTISTTIEEAVAQQADEPQASSLSVLLLLLALALALAPMRTLQLLLLQQLMMIAMVDSRRRVADSISALPLLLRLQTMRNLVHVAWMIRHLSLSSLQQQQ